MLSVLSFYLLSVTAAESLAFYSDPQCTHQTQSHNTLSSPSPSCFQYLLPSYKLAVNLVCTGTDRISVCTSFGDGGNGECICDAISVRDGDCVKIGEGVYGMATCSQIQGTGTPRIGSDSENGGSQNGDQSGNGNGQNGSNGNGQNGSNGNGQNGSNGNGQNGSNGNGQNGSNGNGQNGSNPNSTNSLIPSGTSTTSSPSTPTHTVTASTTSAAASTPLSAQTKSGGISTGAIIGIVGGLCVFLIAMVALVEFAMMKRRQRYPVVEDPEMIEHEIPEVTYTEEEMRQYRMAEMQHERDMQMNRNFNRDTDMSAF